MYLCFLSPQGDKADCFYIVESGEVKIMMKSKVRLLTFLSLHFTTVFHLFACILI